MTPEIIGDLLGAKVLIDRDTRSVIIASDDIPPIKFSIDHPYIQGTKLERNARAALDAQTHRLANMNKMHALSEIPKYRSEEAVTFCGLRGFVAHGSSSEFETVNGDRWEIASNGYRPTCKRCKDALGYDQ